MPLPSATPMPLQRLRAPFDHPDWLFELKYDGFRALAFIEDGECVLRSRNGNRFSSFAVLEAAIAQVFPRGRAILDGEITCLDDVGRAQFDHLMFRRAEACFVCFDALWLRGCDLRAKPLVERKRRLKASLTPAPGILLADFVEGNGTGLFRAACELDLEGIVAKRKHAPYLSDPEQTTWFKIRNPNYSQMVGRRGLFERLRGYEGPFAPWDACTRAAAAGASAN